MQLVTKLWGATFLFLLVGISGCCPNHWTELSDVDRIATQSQVTLAIECSYSSCSHPSPNITNVDVDCSVFNCDRIEVRGRSVQLWATDTPSEQGVPVSITAVAYNQETVKVRTWIRVIEPTQATLYEPECESGRVSEVPQADVATPQIAQYFLAPRTELEFSLALFHDDRQLQNHEYEGLETSGVGSLRQAGTSFDQKSAHMIYKAPPEPGEFAATLDKAGLELAITTMSPISASRLDVDVEDLGEIDGECNSLLTTTPQLTDLGCFGARDRPLTVTSLTPDACDVVPELFGYRTQVTHLDPSAACRVQVEMESQQLQTTVTVPCGLPSRPDDGNVEL